MKIVYFFIYGNAFTLTYRLGFASTKYDFFFNKINRKKTYAWKCTEIANLHIQIPKKQNVIYIFAQS